MSAFSDLHTEQHQQQQNDSPSTGVVPEWDLSYVGIVSIYQLHAVLQIFETARGFYRLFRYRQTKLLQGPQLLIKSLYFAIMIIYGFTIKEPMLAVPIYIGVALVQMLGYLLYIWQWDFIVYYFTVVINTSWYMRQTTVDDLRLGCTLISILLMVAPIFQLFKAYKEKEPAYISRMACFIGAADAVLFFIYSLYDNNLPCMLAAVAKLLIVICMMMLRRELKNNNLASKEKKTN